MIRKSVHLLAAAILLVSPKINFAQSPDLGTAAGFVLFTTTGTVGNTGISHIIGNVGANTGFITGNSSEPMNYSFTDTEDYIAGSYYRLKQTDFDGIFNLYYNGDKDHINSIAVYNLRGNGIYYSGSNQSNIDITGSQSGMYYVHLNLDTKIITENFLLEK